MFAKLRPGSNPRRLLAVAVALTVLLASVSLAHASLGTVGYFQFKECFSCSPEAPGVFFSAGSAAVNANGTGAAAPGDIYAEHQQFSASGQFIRLWGNDTVKSGPGNADETQAVRVDATGGAFKLSLGADTTADIPATAGAGQVQAALEGLASIGPGGVSVSGGPGDAGGSAPYIVSFDGASLAGQDQPLLKATDGGAPLSGGGATVNTYTLNQGSSGFEICQPAEGDECDFASGGGGPDTAIDQPSGNIYETDGSSVTEYSADGHFLRAFGNDVVAVGPDDSSGANEQQKITIKATGGTFTLSFPAFFFQNHQTTAPIPYSASAATVESALDALSNIGGAQGSVSVSGDGSELNPYLVTFGGALGGDDVDEMSASATALLGAGKAVTVATAVNGGGYEVCESDDACKNASFSQTRLGSGESIYVAPPGAPNAGGVLLGDIFGKRVQEFSAAGAFVRTFGWDVVASGPDNTGTGFEVCVPADGDACKPGTSGAGVGQFAEGTLRAVAEDSTGAIYTAENTGFNQSYAGVGTRVQKFTPSGGLGLTPSLFGDTEVQELTVNADAGQFRLSLGVEENGTVGSGDVTAGSPVITNVNTTKGSFALGQPISSDGAGTPELGDGRFYIAALGTGTITLNRAPKESATGAPLFSNLPYTTPDLPFNASPGAVEAALNALPSISANGGSVSVSGGPGGTNPYEITFNGGPLVRGDEPQISTSQGSTPLSGGSGAGANTASVATTTPGGPSGASQATMPFDVAIGPGDRVFVAKLFPTAFTSCPNSVRVSWAEMRIEEFSSSGAALQTSEPCGTDSQGFPSNLFFQSFKPNLTVNPTTGHPYLTAFTLNTGPRLDVLGPTGPAPDLALEPVSKITSTGGMIAGTINPNGPGSSYPGATGDPSSYRTTYRVEYKKTSESSWTKYSPDIPLGAGTSAVPFSIGVGGLAPKTPYELKVVAEKPFTGASEEIKSFTTLGAPPAIEALSSSEVGESSAKLHALINPQGTETTYHFEYGTTPAYGNETPKTDIGEGLSGQAVSDRIEGLADAVYHFRVVATNAEGTTTSKDQTFTFHPPVCPNQTVRQQTGAAYLPDCRAYELVSPEEAGGTVLFTGGPQSPYATNPPRLAFVGQFGAIPGAGGPPINTTGDLYVATRGAEGWRTRYIGPASEEAGCVGGRPLVSGTGPPSTIQNDVMANPGLNRFLDWNLGNPLECFSGWLGDARIGDFNTAAQGSNAPYVWNANGDFLDRWPTPEADVAGSEANFACPQDPSIHPYPEGFYVNVPVSYFCSTYVNASKDLSHFVFSTQSGLFGEGGLTKAPGSAYDNDTVHNTLRLISKLPGGEPIGQEPGAKAGPEELIQFPAVSADGSHVLMGTATKPACKQVDFPHGAAPNVHLCPIITQPTHLYIRVNDAVTYDVSAGKAVHYVGSTPDSTKVYFTSDEQLTADDTDQSTDLYMWIENGGSPQLTRISKGDPTPAGDTDACTSTWTTNCNVKTYDDSQITTTKGNRGGLGSWDVSNPNPGYTDNAVAANSGDIYFYSPEQLVEGKGAPGKENLYAYHEGAVQFVAALEDDPYCIEFLENSIEFRCSNGAVGRLQVTPNGRYAAFITTSRITPYDNHGRAEMYRYDADSEEITCVSCRPDGSAPEGEVLGSEGGRFITDDGRVFFNTPEALDPRDTNTGRGSEGQIEGMDVYEYVDGRAQLITTGTGTGGTTVGLSSSSVAGLYGVSGDGTDVYFGTSDTLVGQDRNGRQLKFYDARTNGGFAFVPPPQPCAAADECHGISSSAPAPFANGTGSSLGAGGNARSKKAHKSKHRKRHGGKPHKRKGKRADHKRGGGR